MGDEVDNDFWALATLWLGQTTGNILATRVAGYILAAAVGGLVLFGFGAAAVVQVFPEAPAEVLLILEDYTCDDPPGGECWGDGKLSGVVEGLRILLLELPETSGRATEVGSVVLPAGIEEDGCVFERGNPLGGSPDEYGNIDFQHESDPEVGYSVSMEGHRVVIRVGADDRNPSNAFWLITRSVSPLAISRLTGVAQVIYLDLRSHGRSDWDDPNDWDYALAGDDIRAFCDEVGIRAPVVLGHSFGGLVVIAYASRHPGHALVLVLQSTFARFNLSRAIDDFRRIGGDEIAEIVRRSYNDDFSLTPEEWRRAWSLFGHWVPAEEERSRIKANRGLADVGGQLLQSTNLMDELSAIDCPTLVSVGELDPIAPVAAAREMVEAMKPGVARLHVVEDAGHFTWRDAPDRFWPVLEEFITSAAERT